MSWIIDNQFPTSNASGVALASHRGAVALSIAADPRHGPEALWFRVRLRRIASDAPAPWLVLRNVDTLLGGGDGSALQPVARGDDGAWKRLTPGEPITHADGRCDVAWLLPDAAAVIETAFCLPYGDDELTALLAGTRSQMCLHTIGTTEGGRPFMRLSNADGAVGSTRPGIYVLARQHAGESPGSWVLDGLLRRMAELGSSAPLIWAIPFVDADGVASGAYGKDRHPIDYNRSWWKMGRRHEVACVMRDIDRWRTRCTPRLCLDLHAPGAVEDDGCYGFTSLGGASPPPEVIWCQRLGVALGKPFASSDFIRSATYSSRWPRETHPSFGAWAADRGLTAFALEIPYQGKQKTAWNVAEYMEIGRRIADAVTFELKM